MRAQRIGLVLLLCCLAFPFGKPAYSQADPVFSQFFSAPIYLNPAFAGSSLCSRIAFNYQYSRYNTLEFSTLNFSYDARLDLLEGGVAVMVTSDHPADHLMRNSFSAAYAYHLRATRDFNIHFGIQAGYIRNDVTWGKLEFADPNEPMPDVTWSHNVDFAAGMLVYNDLFYGGVAAHHITRPNMSLWDNFDSRLDVKYTAHLGAYLEPHTLWRRYRRYRSPVDYFLSPNLVFQSQGSHTSLSYGLYAGADPIMAGVWFRHWLEVPYERDNSFVFMAGISLDNYRIGYSYDYSFSGHSDLFHGSHEISVAMRFNCPRRRNVGVRIIRCPSF